MDLTPGGIGCALGHRLIWQKIVAGKKKMALILEDDAEFHHRFSRLLPSRLEQVPSDWGLLYLGGLDLLSAGKPPRPFVAEGVRRAYTGQRELTAYVLHHQSAQRCLDLTLPLTWQVDTHICSEVTEDPVAKDKYISDPMSYVLQPSLVIQVRALGTDVQKVDTDNPALEDAARRMREFIGGGTSIR
ncbi:glycosyl transferase-like protein [Angomonas deanei]|nr:glycosyl transferase-like protein [Angomonas deanei]|eukprot:EPY41483.1 glycosyl transferase-like protein [Angomonas deanei]